MTRTLRFGGMGLAIVVGLLGCSESHTLEPSDSGTISILDGAPIFDARVNDGSAFPDVGIVTPGDASVMPGDDASVTPGDDGGIVIPVDDASVVVPGDDASVMPGTDAGPPRTDAGSGGVTCGGATCVDPQICCVTFGGGMTSMTCTARGACMGVTATCDGPEDCSSGQACCAMGGPGGGGSTGCVADAMCRFGRLCHSDAECTGRDTCCSFMGASVCSPFCP